MPDWMAADLETPSLRTTQSRQTFNGESLGPRVEATKDSHNYYTKTVDRQDAGSAGYTRFHHWLRRFSP